MEKNCISFVTKSCIFSTSWALFQYLDLEFESQTFWTMVGPGLSSKN